MKMLYRPLIMCAVIGGVALAGLAQDTGAGRQAGSAEGEAGSTPQAGEQAGPQGVLAEDPIAQWSSFMESWLTPRPVPKEGVIFLEDGLCYPHVAVSFKMEVVKVEGDQVWVRGLPPEDPESPLHPQWKRREAMQRLNLLDAEMRERQGFEEKILDFDTPIVPSPVQDGLRFDRAGNGLPENGNWQMSFAVADMNEDGVDDLVFPPPRKGPGRPFIFLGAGDGSFTNWQGSKWPGSVPWDYGGVAVADFDQDGHQDLAIAIHFKTQYVMYGDGQGTFSREVRLPSPDPRVTSRAIGAGDFDGDGWTDLALLAEIDYDMGQNERLEEAATVWIVRNVDGSKWELAENEGLPGVVIGDTVEVTDLDHDDRPDLVLASNATAWRRFIVLNRGGGSWGVIDNYNEVLSNGLHFDVAVPEHQGSRGAEVFAPFTQFKTLVDGETVARTGVVRYHVQSGYVRSQIVVMDEEKVNPYFRVAAGDVNGDGLTDLVVGRKEPQLEVYVQSLNGDFYLERSPEVTAPGRPYDFRLVDLNGDGMDDIVGAFASHGDAKGGIRVWLSSRKS